MKVKIKNGGKLWLILDKKGYYNTAYTHEKDRSGSFLVHGSPVPVPAKDIKWSMELKPEDLDPRFYQRRTSTVQYTREEIIDVMQGLIGCEDVRAGRYKKYGEIELSNDPMNLEGGFLTLVVGKDSIILKDGIDLRESEKGKQWYFAKYKDLEEMVEDMSDFVMEYFSSFETKRNKDKYEY